MGALSNMGAQAGSMFAGSGSAEELARRSLGWGALATGLDVGANIGAGVEGYMRGKYGASILRSNAQAVRAAGQYEESAAKAGTTRTVAEQTVAQAANGIDVGSGSALAVRDATEAIGAMDAAMIHYNAQREAFGLDVEANLLKRAGTSALVRGGVGAAGSFLSGASALSDKWAAYRRSGALNNG